MPQVKINIRKSWSTKDKEKLHESIHKALVDSLKIPDWDYFHRIYEEDDVHHPLR